MAGGEGTCVMAGNEDSGGCGGAGDVGVPLGGDAGDGRGPRGFWGSWASQGGQGAEPRPREEERSRCEGRAPRDCPESLDNAPRDPTWTLRGGARRPFS